MRVIQMTGWAVVLVCASVVSGELAVAGGTLTATNVSARRHEGRNAEPMNRIKADKAVFGSSSSSSSSSSMPRHEDLDNESSSSSSSNIERDLMLRHEHDDRHSTGQKMLYRTVSTTNDASGTAVGVDISSATIATTAADSFDEDDEDDEDTDAYSRHGSKPSQRHERRGPLQRRPPETNSDRQQDGTTMDPSEDEPDAMTDMAATSRLRGNRGGEVAPPSQTVQGMSESDRQSSNMDFSFAFNQLLALEQAANEEENRQSGGEDQDGVDRLQLGDSEVFIGGNDVTCYQIRPGSPCFQRPDVDIGDGTDGGTGSDEPTVPFTPPPSAVPATGRECDQCFCSCCC